MYPRQPPREHIVAGTAVQIVVARIAGELVVAITGDQIVIAEAAGQLVVAITAVQIIVSAFAAQRVVAIEAGKVVFGAVTHDGVVAFRAQHILECVKRVTLDRSAAFQAAIEREDECAAIQQIERIIAAAASCHIG